ncbi:MAG: type I methionyl aminopeptidase [Patescibacteria group bacterium]|nr:MAG: type I methionyl aminopeptidase [Patescibacteria group bacterium]
MDKKMIKSAEEIALIKEGGLLLGEILGTLAKMVKPGLRAFDLEEKAEVMMEKIGGAPAFKGYCSHQGAKPFPSILCISLNEGIVHGPAKKDMIFKDGDIVTLDIGMKYPSEGRGYYTDTAVTVPVGRISEEASKLLEGTALSLEKAIEIIRPGLTILELGSAIEQVLKDYKLGVIKELVGHGVGYGVHEPPQIPNYAFPKNEFPNIALQAGMVIAVEPMATLGGWRIALGQDGITFITADRSLSAHFEHTIIVTERGCEVATARE